MSGWIVYSKDGNIERCRLKALEYGGTAMGERAVTATFDYHSEVAFEVFDYIEYRGERFELESIPTVKKLSSFEYQYELRFVSLKYELERCEMRDLVPSDNGVVYPTPLTFSFTGDVRYLTDRIQACLDAMYGKGVWNIVISDGTKSEEKNISIAQQNCWNALALVNSTYGLSFYIKGRTITIGGEQPLVNHTFEYGKGNGLYEIERASDTGTGIVTKLRAYGSTRNLDYSYPKKPEWSDSVLPVSFALSPLRLMLPSFKEDGKTDYVLADDTAIARYGVREASMVYDDIYPSITGAVNSKGEPMDEIKSVDEVDESKSTFVVYLHDLEFSLEEHLTTEDAQISMKTGTLQGYTFNMTAIDRFEDGSYKITLGRNSLENSEESGAYVPSKDWNMKAGDKFVLLHILLPQKYIREAENRLLARAQEYLAQYSKTNFSYNIGLHDKFLIQNPSVYDSLIEGSKLKVYDKEIGINEEVTIQSITITENAEDNILPQVKVTLNNEPSASTLDRIQGKLNEVAAETAANGFSTQSELMAQYRKKLDKPFFEKLFVAVDKDGNDIAANDVATPIAYIKAKYHFASVGGITMYAMDNDVNVSSIASGLPFDNKTIWYNPSTNQIEVIGGTGGGGEGGVSNFWDLSGIPSWITNSKPKYTYSEIEGTPDLSVYATESWVNTRIDSLINGAPAAYDTLKEIADVLQGNVNSIGDIITALGTKWTQDNTKISNWDTAYSWGNHANAGYALKSYVDSTFVTLGTTQTITGEKNFTGGLKVNGSPIYYDSTKKYWKLEGNLLVTGGITMYGNDSEFTPSTIMDAIQTDGVTIRVNPTTKNLEVIGNTSGATTLGQLQNVGNWADSVADVDRIMYQAAGSSNWVSKNLSDLELKGDYLPLSGGTLKGSSDTPLILRGDTISAWISYCDKSGTHLGSIGVRGNSPVFYHKNINNNAFTTIWHSGNFTPSNYLLASTYTASDILSKLLTVDGSGSGLDADLLDGYHANSFFIKGKSNQYNHGFIFDDYTSVDNDPNAWNNEENVSFKLRSSNNALVISVSGKTNERKAIIQVGHQSTEYASALGSLYLNKLGGNVYIGTVKAATINDNVASATKLETPRTIWGQSFDGSANVSGDLVVGNGDIYLSNNKRIRVYPTSGSSIEVFRMATNNSFIFGNGASSNGYNTYLYGTNLYFGNANGIGITLSSSGNVLIGTTTDNGQKLRVHGSIYANNYGANNNGSVASIIINKGGNPFGIGSSSNVKNLGFGICNSDATWISEWMTITNDGKVGVNITSPEYTLDVNGNARIDGIPIYKSQDDVLYIDGNLVVRGGITMYGTNTTSVPSILDSLPIASTTTKGIASFDSNFFSVGSDGKVTFIGQTGGGVSDSVAWANVTGKPTTLSGYGITDAYTTSTIDTKLSGYLPLSGGSLSSSLTIKGGTDTKLILDSTDGEQYHRISFKVNGTEFGYIVFSSKTMIVGPGTLTFNGNTIYHSGNLTPSNYLLASSYTALDILTKLKTVDGSGSGLDADLLDGVHLSNILRYADRNDNGTQAATAQTITYWGDGHTSHGYTYGTSLNLQGAGSWNHRLDFRTDGWLDYYQGINTNSMSYIGTIAFVSSNVASATKLQTARTIWGHGFNGESGITGTVHTMTGHGVHLAVTDETGWNNRNILATSWTASTADYTEILVPSSTYNNARLRLLHNGNVGIGTPNPARKLQVMGSVSAFEDILISERTTQAGVAGGEILLSGYYAAGNMSWEARIASDYYGENFCKTAGFTHGLIFKSGRSGFDNFIFLDSSGNPVARLSSSSGEGSHHFVGSVLIGETYIASGAIGFNRNTEVGGRFNNSYNGWQFHVDRSDNRLWIYTEGTNSGLKGCWDISGNYLVYGGITMYSDQRKKTILNHVELSLKDIANAPLIEHYYNSDINKTTHVGSIAQYWASMNDWFCKLDSEGFYTMEIQNCALASAISIARELDRYESKTDKTIKQLKKRICQLEEEVERLRAS